MLNVQSTICMWAWVSSSHHIYSHYANYFSAFRSLSAVSNIFLLPLDKMALFSVVVFFCWSILLLFLMLLLLLLCSALILGVIFIMGIQMAWGAQITLFECCFQLVLYTHTHTLSLSLFLGVCVCICAVCQRGTHLFIGSLSGRFVFLTTFVATLALFNIIFGLGSILLLVVLGLLLQSVYQRKFKWIDSHVERPLTLA